MSTSKKIIKGSFLDEESKRDLFARRNKLNNFKRTYKKTFTDSFNLNTGALWNSKFSSIETIDNQDSMTKEKISFVAKHLSNISQPIKLLDVGIGQAYLEQELIKRKVKFELSAIDISSLSINRAKEKYNAIGIVDDALNMHKHFKPKSFDVIVAIEVIEHISPSKIFSFYKQVYKLLKNGGVFIISTPLNEGLKFMKENPNAHVREYTIPILQAEFKLSGFEILKIKTLIAFKSFYILKRFISKILPNRWKPNNIIIIARKGVNQR